MKLGVAGLLGSGDAASIRAVREMGFTVASWHIPNLGLMADHARLVSVREALDDAGLELCQLLPPQYPSLVDPDPDVRAAGVRVLVALLDAAMLMGAPNIYIRPGSLNAAGPWTPHPDNHAPATLDRLVESLRLVTPHAEARGVQLALEGHVVSPVYSSRVMREVVDRVGSASFGVNADVVNLISNLDEAFHPSALVDEFFDLLGAHVMCGHCKDVTVGNRLVVHIEECVPGQGRIDHEQVLQRFQAACPHGAMLIEHLPADQVPGARRAVLGAAERAGLEFDE